MIVHDRLALAEHVMSLWYPQRSGAWLKAVPTGSVLEVGMRARWLAAGDRLRRQAVERDVLQRLLEDHFNMWTPEDSPYSEFVSATWRHCDRTAVRAGVDRLLAEAARRIAGVEEREAQRRAEAEADGWQDDLPPPVHEDLMTDLPALRRWFLAELWGEPRPSWWTTEGSRGCRTAFVGIDEYLIAILWLP